MAAYFWLVLVFQACVLVFSEGIPDEDLVVLTTAGKIRGSSRELNGETYRVFAGVPYAEPPIGELRFKPPVSKVPWNPSTILSTTDYNAACPQNADKVSDILPAFVVPHPDPSLVISEDCLSLNVYTPYPVNESSNLAVLVWLHGGNYRQGESGAYDACPLAVKGDIIVVTINYRLGAFGFLYTGDENAPGNMGLMDQQLALEWVRDNIQAFGGDPSRVTLGGQAGVYGSATLHLFANASRPLFQRVLAHSGIFSSHDLGEPQRAWMSTEALAANAGCPSETNVTLVDCLKKQSMEEILSFSDALSEDWKSSFAWRPVFTPDFFIKEPSDSMKYNLLSLVNSGDGTVALELLKDISPDAKPEASSQLTQEEWMNWFLSFTMIPGLTEKATKHEYVKNDFENDHDKNVALLIALVDSQSDHRYKSNGASAIHAMNSFLSSAHVMVFDHQSSYDMRFRPELKLAPHGSELPYIFGIPFDETRNLGGRFTEDEKQLSIRLIQLWANFVKKGDPNGAMDMNPSGENLTWPEFGPDEKLLKVQLKEAVVGEEYRKDGVYFWGKYMPSLRASLQEACPAFPPTPMDCEELIVGRGLGLSLTASQAETVIESLIFAFVASLCLSVVILGIMVGYRSRLFALVKRYGREHQMGEKNDTRGTEKAPVTAGNEVGDAPSQPDMQTTSFSEADPTHTVDVDEQAHAPEYIAVMVDKHVGTSTSPNPYANVPFSPGDDEPDDDPEEQWDMKEDFAESPLDEGNDDVTYDEKEDMPPPPSMEQYPYDYHNDEPMETPLIDE